MQIITSYTNKRHLLISYIMLFVSVMDYYSCFLKCISHKHALLLFQTLLMTQRINLRAENEEARIPDTACQDHMIGKLF